MTIYLERIYNAPQHNGYRVLTDRVWPRGISKQKAACDAWCKELSPTTALRKWFGHDPQKWKAFSQNYLQELKTQQEEAKKLLQRAANQPLILLTATKDMDHTHIIVLKDYLNELQKNTSA